MNQMLKEQLAASFERGYYNKSNAKGTAGCIIPKGAIIKNQMLKEPPAASL
jgi:hypothetical protein